MDRAKAITVVCITFKKGALLQKSLEAALAELGPHDEIVVIDDGGHDYAIVSSFEDSRLRYVEVPHRGYQLSRLCNLGTALARTEYVIKIDGDCMLIPGALNAYRRDLAEHGLVAGRIEKLTQEGAPQLDLRFDYEDGCKPVQGPYHTYGGNLGYRQTFFWRVGGFLEHFCGRWGCEDTDLGMRMSAVPCLGFKLSFEAGVRHQWHPTSSAHSEEGYKLNYDMLVQNMEAYQRKLFPGPKQPPMLHVRLTHLGHRSFEETLTRALQSLLEAKIPFRHKFWVVLQESDAAGKVGDLLDGQDFEILESEENRGTAWPKKVVQEQIGPEDYFFNLDDDMEVPPGAIEQLYALLRSGADVGCAVLHSPRLQMAMLAEERGKLIRLPTRADKRVCEVQYTGYGASMMSPLGLACCRFDDRFFVGAVDLDIALQLHRARLRTYVYTGMQAKHAPPVSEAYTKRRWDRGLIEEQRVKLEDKWGLQISKL